MSTLGIVPSPADDPYLELGASPQGRMFRKQILRLGPLVHPKDRNKVIQIDEPFTAALKRNFDNGVSMTTFQLANEKNEHDERPERCRGEVLGLESEGDKVYALIDVRDEATADQLGKTILGASAMLSLDYKDPRSGQSVGPALMHVCATSRPYCLDLDPYSEVVAATDSAFDMMPDYSLIPPKVLMLSYSEVDPAQVMLSPAPEARRPAMQYTDADLAAARQADQADAQRVDSLAIGLEVNRLARDHASELGPRLAAFDPAHPYAHRPSVGSRPSYDHYPAPGWQPQQAALSHTDAPVSIREMADRYGKSFALVADMAAGVHRRADLGYGDADSDLALGVVDAALSRGQQVSDAQIMSLSQARRDAEQDLARLTSSDEGMFGLAHPRPGSGKPVTTGNRPHEPDEEGSDVDDPDTAYARYRELRPDLFGAEDLDAGTHGTHSHGPKSPAQREREQVRALAGGRPGERSIEDLSRGSARTRYGR